MNDVDIQALLVDPRFAEVVQCIAEKVVNSALQSRDELEEASNENARKRRKSIESQPRDEKRAHLARILGQIKADQVTQ